MPEGARNPGTDAGRKSPEASAPGSAAKDEAPGRTGIIFDIKRFAIHDGPGIRTTVFLKGCPLACKWCHNPESLLPQPEHAWRRDRCVRCGVCIEACDRGAIAWEDGRPVHDPARCVLCGQCVQACPTGAREIIGRRASAAQIMAEVERDIIFYDESGGGVTFSGGEPLMQPALLGELLAACRRRQIHTAVDTTCHAPWDVLESLRGSVDLYLCDIKHADSAAHERLTGVGNALILENLRKLAHLGERITVRVPVIPGLNDDEANVAATGRLISSLDGVTDVDILPYNEGGRSKLARLARDEEPPDIKAPSPEHMAAIAQQLAAFGLTVKTGG